MTPRVLQPGIESAIIARHVAQKIGVIQLAREFAVDSSVISLTIERYFRRAPHATSDLVRGVIAE